MLISPCERREGASYPLEGASGSAGPACPRVRQERVADEPQPDVEPLPTAQLNVQGDAGFPQGATWTYRGDFDGATFDLQGVLFKPPGAGNFAAVILSHGGGGNAVNYSSGIATEMVSWGLVAHCDQLHVRRWSAVWCSGFARRVGREPIEHSPRARRAWDPPASRLRRYATHRRHGHSQGAFVTSVLLATYVNDFRVASHTAGGARPDALADGISPSESQVQNIPRRTNSIMVSSTRLLLWLGAANCRCATSRRCSQ